MKCETSNDVAVITDMLAEVGWTRDGARLVPAHDSHGVKHARCAVFDGLIYGVPRTAFICVESHLAMLTGCQTDLTLKEFIKHILHGDPVKPSVPKRGLFDDHD